MRRDLEEQLIGQFGWTVQQTLAHLESSVLVHGITQQHVRICLALIQRSALHSNFHCIIYYSEQQICFIDTCLTNRFIFKIDLLKYGYN